MSEWSRVNTDPAHAEQIRKRRVIVANIATGLMITCTAKSPVIIITCTGPSIPPGSPRDLVVPDRPRPAAATGAPPVDALVLGREVLVLGHLTRKGRARR